MIRRLALPVAVIVLAVAAAQLGSVQAATVTVDASVTHQTMRGWEFTPRTWEQDKENDRYDPSFLLALPAILDAAVNELGLNRIRLEIRSGDENPIDYFGRFVEGTIGYEAWRANRYEKVNDNRDPNNKRHFGFQFSFLDWQIENFVLPTQALLAARGERLYINLCYVDFASGAQGSLSHAQDPEEYAELIDVFVHRMENKYGLKPDALEIVLEPDLTRDWNTGTRVGQAMIAAVDRLAARGAKPDSVIAPSCTSAPNALGYFDEMIQLPGVRERLTTLSYHRYTAADENEFARRAQTYGVETAMSEFLGADIDELFSDVGIARNSFWQQWGLATNGADEGKNYILADMQAPGGPRVTLSSRSQQFQQVFRYVRLGAVRIGADSDSSRYRPLAFINSNGQHVLAVRNRSDAPFTVRGLPAGTYGVTFSDASGNNHVGAADVTIAEGEAFTAAGAASGVVTIFGKTGDGASIVVGDVDGNGSVNSTDALLELQVSVGARPQPDPGTPDFTRSDADGDGSITVTDVLVILQSAVGLG